ncbi:histidine kinase [Gallibacterium salpingitidis]|uniref:Histidine kinase n=1 Tax=Gallibacterium salpingitidis TaxID=505341 RepID=A0AB36E077_9PAST|nr:GAF domain-containing protein [Gallibacterium salpingitidis]OBX06872.1 histidine kinase [Gallibacterium salpingitidis]OBX07612.1 histidine kinase [Gallibacterium salpingitidis]WKT00184.1 GAF domain-containing protein [Gallibacterium salpingitidis]
MFSFSDTDLNDLPINLQALIADDDNLISVLANTSALLNQYLPEINWVGFYLLNAQNVLTLGPFQGKIACTRIPVGKGVCGQAVAQNKVLRIDDVHQFAGHIACDSASNAEIVLPLYHQGKIIGVLDIDSPKFARFTEQDQHILERCMQQLTDHLSTLNI